MYIVFSIVKHHSKNTVESSWSRVEQADADQNEISSAWIHSA